MTAILGISAFYHDSAAALVVDGKIVAAAQEERFTRKKHDHGFPVNAIKYCLGEGRITPQQLDYVGFYDKPFLKFERLLETYLAFAPVGFRSFLKAMPLWLHQKLHLPREMRKGLDGGYNKRFIFSGHHESHAASAFFPSPFEEAAILTLDGAGEWATAAYGYGRGNQITLTHELRFPHSLGLLYSAFTYFCGFKVNSGEYKLMGLAPYGEPKYKDLILDKLLDLKYDGSFRLDLSYFEYCQGLKMTSNKFSRLFGGPPRRSETPLTQREMDLAASIQLVTEEIMLRSARHLHGQTGMKNLCLAGGVALNCVGNGRISREGPFENIWVQPAAGDAGGALGVAQLIWYQLLQNERTIIQPDGQYGSQLGPCSSNQQIREFLDAQKAKYRHFSDESEICDYVADLIASEKVIGWMHGRAEFGPRALGCRSILGDARSSKMQSVMNLKIKFRESFRPFAPVVLQERASEFFEMDNDKDSPYMLMVSPVSKTKRIFHQSHATGLDKLKTVRSQVPAITHVDNSARVQTVDRHRHGRFQKLMKAFEAKTDCPVMINTSFNVRGEPIVGTPEDAYRCFMATGMDALVMEDFVLLKEEQPAAEQHEIDDHLSKFQLD
ncbi:MAG: carbamoyltransferase [Pirellulales bacterium]|nr:carbamoyltransferase [Pirellulales bacterium]